MPNTQFNENLNIIGESNLEIQLLDGDLAIIQKLDDEPNDVGGLSAQELKAKFDEGGLAIQKYINETLIPAVLAEDAVEAQRAANEAQRQSNEQQRVADENVRLEAEADRTANEQTRSTNEATREANESARVAAEAQRAASENERKTAEAIRQSNEEQRQNIETGYIAQAEAAAKRAENAEASAGVNKTAAEQAATNAATSATNAATSAINASTHATNARNSAAQSAAEATRASNSADAANLAKSAAESAAQNAAAGVENRLKTYVADAEEAKSGAEMARDEINAKKYANTVSASIPKGRMKGDVDGDGVITEADYNAVRDDLLNPSITEEIALWCADVNGNGKIDTGDPAQISNFVLGRKGALTATPRFADYYGNWTYVKIDDFTGEWYADIAVSGMTETSDALVVVSGEHFADEFSAECVSGAVRITAQTCPIAEIPCQIMWSAEGGGIAAVVPEKTESSVSAVLPKGRMRGDVDGDGKVTMDDAMLVANHVSNTATLAGAEALWCADADGNGVVNGNDAQTLMLCANGASSALTVSPAFADYYNNWTYSRIDDLTGKWTAEIPVTGMTPTSDALIIVSGEHTADEFSAECIRGAVRITAKVPPIAEIPCRIVRSAVGSGIVCIKPEKEIITPASIGAMASVSAALPKGRMKGDVDGDGVITMSDYDLIYNHVKKVEYITDEIALWCADVNQNGDANMADYAAVMKYISGETSILTSTPTFADYYSNWTYTKNDDLTGRWHADIAIAGVTATSDALIIVSGEYASDAFTAECVDGAVRVYAKTCPIADVPCRVMWSANGAGVVVIRPETVVDKTAIDGMTLNSSTAGSAKKFKLSVDDSGTITAVEV